MNLIKRIFLTLAMVLVSVAMYAETDTMPKNNEVENVMTTQTTVLLKTNKGDIKIALDGENAPLTAKNFINYVEEGFYDGTIFHRVIDGFMVQGGGFEPGMVQKETKAPISNEANNGLSNKIGTLAMARTMDPHSATGQFFINVGDNNFLDFTAENSQGWGYAVFGEVIEGMDVVEAIKGVETTFRAGHQDVPAEDIVIEKASIVN